MNKKIFFSTVAITLSLVGGATVYAAGSNSANKNHAAACLNQGKNVMAKGHTVVESVLKDKFGVTQDEINKAEESGKSLHDIANEKGITDDQLKAAVAEEKIKSIDQAVKDGTISESRAENMKERIKSGQMGKGHGMNNADCGNCTDSAAANSN